MEIRKTNVPSRGSYRSYSSDNLTEAYLEIKDKSMSIRKASKLFNVPKSTLQDRISGKIDVDVVKSGSQPLFSNEQEALLAGHLKTMAEVGYGYSRQETINIASEYATCIGVRDKEHPLTDRWLYKFLGRWPELNIKKPRSLEIARAKSATKVAVEHYFDELHHILLKYDLFDKPHRVYNVDEKGLSTEHKPPKVVSSKFSKTQAVTSGKGKNVTLIGAVNGIGQQVPPFFIFPGCRMMDSLMAGASPGAAGSMSETGWSNTELFSYYMKHHLVKYLPPTQEHTLVLYDGHKSHVSLTLIEWAKSQKIILFVLPPHCSHILQPLDVSCFGPFEVAWNSACHNHMRESGGRLVTRYDVCQLACKVYGKTLSPANVQAAFRKCGIYPFDRSVVPESQLAPSTTFPVQPYSVHQVHQVQSQSAENFLLQKGGQILENVQKAKVRNTISKVVGGKAITEDDIIEKIIEHNAKSKPTNAKENQRKRRTVAAPTPSTSGVPAKKQRECANKIVPEDEDSSDNDDDIPESEKCVVCKKFSVESSKRPDIVIVKWAECDQCKGWVHLSFCTAVKVIRRGDIFICPDCANKK